jgi:hypothetical protein
MMYHLNLDGMISQTKVPYLLGRCFWTGAVHRHLLQKNYSYHTHSSGLPIFWAESQVPLEPGNGSLEHFRVVSTAQATRRRRATTAAGLSPRLAGTRLLWRAAACCSSSSPSTYTLPARTSELRPLLPPLRPRHCRNRAPPTPRSHLSLSFSHVMSLIMMFTLLAKDWSGVSGLSHVLTDECRLQWEWESAIFIEGQTNMMTPLSVIKKAYVSITF